MESWRTVFRDGFAPVLPTEGLFALREALRRDDPALIQGATCSPPPLYSEHEKPCVAADAVTYCGWKGNDLETVRECEEFFARACFEADERLGGPGECRWFLNAYDDMPRDEMRWELLAEIDTVLAARGVNSGGNYKPQFFTPEMAAEVERLYPKRAEWRVAVEIFADHVQEVDELAGDGLRFLIAIEQRPCAKASEIVIDPAEAVYWYTTDGMWTPKDRVARRTDDAVWCYIPREFDEKMPRDYGRFHYFTGVTEAVEWVIRRWTELPKSTRRRLWKQARQEVKA